MRGTVGITYTVPLTTVLMIITPIRLITIVCGTVQDITTRKMCVIMLTILLFFRYHEHDDLPWSKTNAIYTSKGITCVTTFTIIFIQ